MTGNWRLRAACLAAPDPEDAFGGADTVRVRQFVLDYCANCEVIGECLRLALRAERSLSGGLGRHGVFGGLTAEQRGRFVRLGTRPCVDCGASFIPNAKTTARCRGCIRPRRAPRGEQTEHGTRSGYEQHLHRDVAPCAACRSAKAAYDAKWRAGRRVSA